ncbi:MAG: flagellar M-ring protein FliF [Spirochaetes bacterium]|nr:flagellar M-ring protein FliF [Spirochaetota bacterium]
MNDFFKNILDSINKIYGKLSLIQKLIAAGVLLVAIGSIVVIFVLNSTTAGVPLFTQKIDIEDYGKITKKLESEGINFSTKDNSIIIVKDQNTKNKIIMMLAQEGSMPKGRYTFLDIIKDKKLTTSKFENSIKLRAALEGKLEELLRAADVIHDADVSFTMPEPSVFVKEREPVKVAVILTPSWNVNLSENKKSIKGIEELIVNSIDGATKENVVITDNRGIKLNDFTDEEDINAIKITKENLKIRNEQTAKYIEQIYKALSLLYEKDRISVMVDVAMNFDKEKENRKEILPVVLREDNPETPYDDSEKVYSITESEKTVNENFKGPNWIPEGPPGFDENVPPAYKGALEQMTEYIKDEKIRNETFGESLKEKQKDPWDIDKITASVTIDGKWEIVYDDQGKPELNKDGTRKRQYLPVSDEDLKKVKGFVEQGIGFSLKRGDKVEVYSLPKDRSKQFALDDAKWRAEKSRNYAIIAGLIALLLLIIITIVYRLVAKELERRKRLREEELARQHQLAREMALKSAEEEAGEIEMSLEDKTRLEMQENAINIAREHPEEVAQLIRTWLTEE